MTATLTRYSKPHPEYLDRVVVALALSGRFGRIGRELSDAEAVAVLGPLLDRVDEAAAHGWRHDGALARFQRFMSWSNATKTTFERRARPGRFPVGAQPQPGSLRQQKVRVSPPCTATEHGTTAAAYRKKKCRCPAARAAWSAYITDYQARRKEAA